MSYFSAYILLGFLGYLAVYMKSSWDKKQSPFFGQRTTLAPWGLFFSEASAYAIFAEIGLLTIATTLVILTWPLCIYTVLKNDPTH
jgi:hypothetical protein